MIRIVDAAWEICPMVTPTLFVDDLSAEMAAPVEWILDKVGQFVGIVAKGFKEGEMELSETKSLCSASTKATAVALCEEWEKED